MLKAKILSKQEGGKDQTVFLLGLTLKDIDILMGHVKIVLNGDEFGLPATSQIVIVYGKTEAEIESVLGKYGCKPREPF